MMNSLKKSVAIAAIGLSGLGVAGASMASAVSPAPCAQGRNICPTSAGHGAFSTASGPALNGAANTARNWAQSQANYYASVKHIQARLGLAQDGIFGNGTRNAVMAFQRSHHLPANGVVNASTARAMGLNFVDYI